MDKDLVLSNLENMGYVREEDYQKRAFTNKLIPIEMTDPETGETEIIQFYDGPVGYNRKLENVSDEEMASLREVSPEGIREKEKEAKWRSGEDRYMPGFMQTIPKELSISNLYSREYKGEPTRGYLNYPNPEYEVFKTNRFLSLIRSLDYNRRKGHEAGKQTIEFPMTHPCRANSAKVWDDWTLGDFVTIPVSGEPRTFFQYQRVKYSKNPKAVYVILDGPEPKNNLDRAKYLIAGSSKKAQEEYPEWVKGSLLESVDGD
jgi:hypothetical protein